MQRIVKPLTVPSPPPAETVCNFVGLHVGQHEAAAAASTRRAHTRHYFPHATPNASQKRRMNEGV